MKVLKWLFCNQMTAWEGLKRKIGIFVEFSRKWGRRVSSSVKIFNFSPPKKAKKNKFVQNDLKQVKSSNIKVNLRPTPTIPPGCWSHVCKKNQDKYWISYRISFTTCRSFWTQRKLCQTQSRLRAWFGENMCKIG